MLRKVCLGIALAFLLTASAWADFVSGRVLGLDGNPVGGKTFTAEKGGQKVSFSTDKAGNFSVYLDPGTYVVHFSDEAAPAVLSLRFLSCDAKPSSCWSSPSW